MNSKISVVKTQMESHTRVRVQAKDNGKSSRREYQHFPDGSVRRVVYSDNQKKYPVYL